MILVPLFEIPYGNGLAKNVKKPHVQVIRRFTDKAECIDSHIFFKGCLKLIFGSKTMWNRDEYCVRYPKF